jgi:hypothetical protein
VVIDITEDEKNVIVKDTSVESAVIIQASIFDPDPRSLKMPAETADATS